jgi:hypothetical protein
MKFNKFNFERIKDEGKKLTMEIGVIASTIGGINNGPEQVNIFQVDNLKNKGDQVDNSSTQEKKMLYVMKKNEEKQKTAYNIDKIREELGLSVDNNKENKLDPEFYRNEYIRFMKDPSYKLRLAKEMYGDKVIDGEKQKNIDKEYENRLKIINEISISMIPDTDSPYADSSHAQAENGNTSVVASPRLAPHELTHALDPDLRPEFSGKMRNDAGFVEKKKEYLNDYLYNISRDIMQIEEEKSEALKNIDTNVENENDIKNRYDRILNKLKEIQNYYGTSPEIKARLEFLRIKAMKEHGYNPSDDFDINKFEDLKKDAQYQELIDKLKLNNDQINDLMKYTADNTEDKKGDYRHPGWNYDNPENNNA